MLHASLCLVCGFLLVVPALAFENAKVLPANVRNLNIRTVNTNIATKSDDDWQAQPLAQPLAQNLTFAKIAQGESNLAAKQLEGFLLTEGLGLNDAVGIFSADLRGHIGVSAAILSYGVTERLTIAAAVPYYRASTSISVGFRKNETGQRFLNALARRENNNQFAAREAAGKLNNAVGRLNDKLIDNGYRTLEDWQDEGMGDVTLAAKYQLLKSDSGLLAATGGVVAPTGRRDDPDILNDVAFGDGQYDVFGQIAADQPIISDIVINEYGKYTVQLPGERDVRLATADESIEVAKRQSQFKLGDKYEAGFASLYQPNFGLIAGLGYSYLRKFGDVYRDVDTPVKAKLEGGSDQKAHNAEAQLGYSTVPMYQRGQIAAPFEIKLTYTKQLASSNLPVTDLAQLDLNLFF